jgi:hypothetical protein
MLAVGWTCEIRVCIRVMRHGRLGTIDGADRLAILTLDACHVQTSVSESVSESECPSSFTRRPEARRLSGSARLRRTAAIPPRRTTSPPHRRRRRTAPPPHHRHRRRATLVPATATHQCRQVGPGPRVGPGRSTRGQGGRLGPHLWRAVRCVCQAGAADWGRICGGRCGLFVRPGGPGQVD